MLNFRFQFSNGCNYFNSKSALEKANIHIRILKITIRYSCNNLYTVHFSHDLKALISIKDVNNEMAVKRTKSTYWSPNVHLHKNVFSSQQKVAQGCKWDGIPYWHFLDWLKTIPPLLSWETLYRYVLSREASIKHWRIIGQPIIGA